MTYSIPYALGLLAVCAIAAVLTLWADRRAAEKRRREEVRR